MSVYPPTRLHVSSEYAVAICGPYIHIIDLRTGGLTAREKTDSLIRCSATDLKWARLVTAGDDKKLRVWDLKNGNVSEMKLLSERELPKKPTEIRITQDSETILVSDKFGDVFRYPMTPKPEHELPPTKPQNAGRSALTSHENLAGGSLVLGHASLLTTFRLSDDEKFIITADRDEHIRVSWYPQGFVAEQYCLGHTKFVSAIHIPTFSPSTLISGGGDSYLQCWDWTTGKKGATIPILDAVLPYIKVKPPKGRPWSTGDGDEDGGDEKPGRKKGKKGGKGKGKGKGKAQGGGTAEDPVPEAADGVGGEVEAGNPAEDVVMVEDTPQEQEQAQADPSEEPLTLVVLRIETAELTDGTRWVVFSAVGATALFYLPYPTDPEAAPPPISAFDLGKPVLEFVPVEDEKFVVLVDEEWIDPSSPNAEPPKLKEFARSVNWGKKKTKRIILETAYAPSLNVTLNTMCLKPATPAELKAADIYGHLASMPKNVDPEHDPMVRDDLATLDPSAMDEDIAASSNGKLTQRELARLKNKKALIESIREKKAGKSATPEVGDVSEVERENKKVKSDDE